ncbi:histidine kinase dimerization/phospho-acceptor domain-containing protein [Fibrella aestuarina]|nr:histidine kinase dimerization/phospho-acceptor domain-containing protein [Fibrella aestuarina]
MSRQQVIPAPLIGQEHGSSGTPTSEEHPIDQQATTLQALLDERTAQLEKANEALARAQADLRRANRQGGQQALYLQAVLNNSPAAIGYIKAVFDKPDPLEGDPLLDSIIDYQLVALNDKFAAIVGEPVGQLVGQSASRLAGLLWQEVTYANFYRIIAEDVALYEERAYDEAGQPRWWSISAAKHDGGVVLTYLDVTELRQTQLQREALRQQADEAIRVTAQLAALRQQLNDRGASMRVASHDIRSSIGVVSGATQLLKSAESDADRVHLLDMINRNVDAMTHLLADLIDASPIGTDR